MNIPPVPPTAEETLARQLEVENAILVQVFFGRQLAPTVHEQLQRYVVGELSREEAFASFYSNHG